MNDLKEGKDYLINENGDLVFTREYHLRRGYCCKSGCFHCPYGFSKEETPEELVERKDHSDLDRIKEYLGDDWSEI